MIQPIKLGIIPADKYKAYRYEVIFKAYKWDPQVEDQCTIAGHAVLMEKETALQLELWAEGLAKETMLMEEALLKHPSLVKDLGLPKEILKTLSRLAGYDRPQHPRLMRFDFHPTTTGWAVSEVNSDVPGGLAEASVLPQLASKFFDGYGSHHHVGHRLLQAFKARTKSNGTIAFVHATSYSDDQQVMQFLADYFQQHGYRTVLAAPDHIRWVNKKAFSIIEGQAGNLEGMIRFFPLEWLSSLPKNTDWKGYFDTSTPSCNHPIAMLSQSKRLPLIWDKLEVDLPMWRSLLPETKEPKVIKELSNNWIYKPALGRVGEGISIQEAVPQGELSLIKKAARRYSKDWIVQHKFSSQPLMTENNEALHLCIGVFTVDGRPAGFYGRVSPYPLIDARAKDIPILISKEGKKNEG